MYVCSKCNVVDDLHDKIATDPFQRITKIRIDTYMIRQSFHTNKKEEENPLNFIGESHNQAQMRTQ